MYLKRLEINGFKSFANKTVLDFLPECDISNGKRCGITAIVGPNGSGKSNVADAIRWAIGEQSSKNLRGKKSEDVIFSGSGKKARLGSAAVTLYFDNSDKRIPIEYSDVSIARKVYRNGEGEYFINGNHVRLLDVVDLLARAGVGRESYCVITQGMSDAVLQATPLERRSIFEDAAGVKPYQIEKDRARRKLESTRENITRVETLLVEIEPHLKHLRRQAEKASQAKTLVERLRAKQVELYGFLWAEFQHEREALMHDRDASTAKTEALERSVEALRQDVEMLSKSVEEDRSTDTFSEEIETLRAEKNTNERSLAILSGRIEIEEEKKKDREEVTVIPVDLPYVRGAIGTIEKEQKILIQKISDVKDLSELGVIRDAASGIARSLRELDEKAGAGTVMEKKIISLPEEERKAIEEKLAALAMEQKTLEQSIAVFDTSIAEKEELIRLAREKGREAREKFFHTERELREKEQMLQREKDALNETKVRLARVEVREEDVLAEVRAELAMDPASLAWDGEPKDRDRLTREISRLKVESEQAGGIDPFVLEEYEETEKRFQFLSKESEDLKKAMESLEGVIAEMDEKIDHAFEEAFDSIAKEFERYFGIIFNGGKAELKKIRIRPRRRAEDDGDMDSEVPEENETEGELGIEISACPPGKRIANLSMLSGGERSLTSLALLFSIISHNPPPFAVLDEVEAALDEANSRRFSRVLQDLGTHTQFIAITHNRETMRQASLLYGVTMGEDGVSKLLSVKFDQVNE